MKTVQFSSGMQGLFRVTVLASDTFASNAAQQFGIELKPMQFHPHVLHYDGLSVKEARAFAAYCE